MTFFLFFSAALIGLCCEGKNIQKESRINGIISYGVRGSYGGKERVKILNNRSACTERNIVEKGLRRSLTNNRLNEVCSMQRRVRMVNKNYSPQVKVEGRFVYIYIYFTSIEKE